MIHHNKNKPPARRLTVLLAMLLAMLTAVSMSTPAMADTGVDNSNWQGCVSGQSIALAGGRFGISKATEGIGYTDPSADCSIQSAINAGLYTGSYHFARPETGNTATGEADWYISQTRGYIGQHVMPILDFEPPANTLGQWMVDWAYQWLQRVETAYGVKPMIYLNYNTLWSLDWSLVANAGYGLWIAYPAYDGAGLFEAGAPPYDVSPWPFAAMWQYSWTATGPSPDANVFYGDADTWAAYAGGHPATPDGTATTPMPSPSPAPEQQPSPGRPFQAVIEPGDTMSQVAAQFGLWPVDAWSVPSGDPNRIWPGDVVTYHGDATAQQAQTPATPAVHALVVEAGDTLWSISQQFNIPMSSLYGYSSGDPNLIYPGETLYY